MERIVVALDAASEHRAAIGAAARLAARWKVRLHGVFVEDDDLIRLAHLPFARQFTVGFGAESLDLAQAQRQMRVFAERARQELAAIASRYGVAWSFEVASGAPGGSLATATGDFVVACTATRPVGGYFRVECRWWAAESGTATRLLTRREGDGGHDVAVLPRGRDQAAGRLLDAAVRLAEADEARLTVFCSATLADDPGFRPWLDQRLAGHAVETDVEIVPGGTNLHRLFAESQCRLVAIGAGDEAARPDRLRAMVAATGCDVLVVP